MHSPSFTSPSAEHPSQQGYNIRSRKRPQKRKDNDDGSNPKRRRESMHHPERLSCLPCALWFQSGRSAHLQQYHPIANSRQAGSDALSLALYESYDNINFHLESRDCVCQPCYKDYVINKHNRENAIPR